MAPRFVAPVCVSSVLTKRQAIANSRAGLDVIKIPNRRDSGDFLRMKDKKNVVSSVGHSLHLAASLNHKKPLVLCRFGK